MSSAQSAPNQPQPDAASASVPDDPLALLQQLPTPVLLVAVPAGGAAAVVAWVNPAAAAALSAAPGSAWRDLWRTAETAEAADRALLEEGGVACLLEDLAGQPWRLRVRPRPDGTWLVSAESALPERDAHQRAEQLSALLDLARGFGRLGVWERDMRTLAGRWDRQLQAIWGFDPDAPLPDYADVIARVHPADLPGLQDRFQQSLAQAGRHAMRFRVRGQDGDLRHLHSQWLVLAGDDGLPQRQIGLMMDDTEPFALARSALALESQLELAAELAGISVWRYDLASERLRCGPRGWQALGLEPVPDGLPLDKARTLVHDHDLSRVRAAAQVALAGGRPVEVEARCRHAGGGWVLQVLRGNLLRDESGEPMALIGVAMAASELLQQRRRAEEMAQRFELVTDAAGIGYWLWEPGSAAPQWGARLRQIHGLAPDQPAPTTPEWLEQFIHPDDHAAVRAVLGDLDSGRRLDAQVRFRIRRADGEQRILMSHAVQQQRSDGPLLVGVVIDLTDQLRTEQALLAAKEREALALQAAGMGVWQLDDTGDGALWDAQMWRLRGRPPGGARVTAAQAHQMVHPDDLPHVQSLWQPGASSMDAVEREFRVVWPDGQVRWLVSRSTEHTDPATGRSVRLGINWDVTDRRTADLVRQERELARRAGEARSRFLARMSHELRTPLNAMLGYAQLMQAEPDAAPARMLERARQITTAGGHLLALINDVLELAGLEGGEWRVEPTPVALHTAVREVLALVQPQIAAGSLQVEADLPEAHVLADTTRLRQVLLNLLSNAIKYNRQGGRLGLRIRHDAGPPAKVMLAVRDEGPGLSAEQQQRLFEPFNRLGAEHAGVPGHGIGLAIVKALVTRMQGEVRVHSTPGQGTEFSLWLQPADVLAAPGPAGAHPASARSAGPDTAAGGLAQALSRPSVAGAPTQQHRVLYVEDNPVNAQIMTELLAMRGDVVVRVADTGQSGLQLAADWQPELLLLDMQLPDMDGCSFLARLRRHPATAAMPCIAVSANAMPDDIRQALDAGAVAYWTKPLDFGAVLRELGGYLGPPAPRR